MGAAIQRVAIVGGGAAGVVAAYHLAGRPGLEVALVDRTGRFGPGVPYATTDPDHRLNVAADRMGAVAEDPADFLEWLKAAGRQADGNDFVSRGTFGEYLVDLLARAETRAASSGPPLRKVVAEITDVSIGADRTSVGLVGAPELDGVGFDHVVLAPGPLPGGDPISLPDAVRQDGTYVPNAWEMSERGRAEDETTLIIGCGLTMIDAAISIAGRPGGGKVVAVSRTGALPLAHRADYVTIDPPVLPLDGPVGFGTAVSLFTDAERRARAAGGDWRDAMDSMRPITPELWRRMPESDKRWFLDNLQRIWESHRYRMAPEIAERFEKLRRSGRVEVRAGQIAAVEPDHPGARVTLAGGGASEILQVGRIINCTGASADVLTSAPPLIRDLIRSGLVAPDPLRLGLDVSRDGRAIDRDGKESDRISLIGSIRRGAEWESIGITEIRSQAATIAERLSRTPPARS